MYKIQSFVGIKNIPSLWMFAARGTHYFKASCPKRQSPVDINSGKVVEDPALLKNPLQWCYDGVRCTEMMNEGQGWRINIESNNVNLQGGPLGHRYSLTQFHSHWGFYEDSGSEHTVDQIAFSSELHLVHWNTDLYNNPEEAMSGEFGLAVLAIFFEIGIKHEEINKITSSLPSIMFKGRKCSAPDVDVKAFIPTADTSYWTYYGSLTCPPMYESVTWIIFQKSLQMSRDQLMAFRKLPRHYAQWLNATYHGRIWGNVRTLQPLERRVVKQPPRAGINLK